MDKNKNPLKTSRYENITFSLGVECCSLEEYLDLCCDAPPVLALFPLHLVLSTPFLCKGSLRLY